MSNYSILTRNTLDGMSETACSFYLCLLDKFGGHSDRNGERAAFLAALKYDDNFGEVLEHIMASSPAQDLTADARASVSDFVARRYMHNFMDDSA